MIDIIQCRFTQNVSPWTVRTHQPIVPVGKISTPVSFSLALNSLFSKSQLVITLAGEEVTLFKSNKCIKKMDRTMKAMKEFKLGKKGVGGCLNAFKACKTAEKAAPG